MISKLCKHYSPPLLSLPAPDIAQDGTLSEETEEDTYHPFPPPSILADPSVSATLRGLGFGYRADFIQRTAQMLVDAHGTTCSSNGSEASEKWLHTLRTMETPMAREELLEFVGVGRKVYVHRMILSQHPSLTQAQRRLRAPNEHGQTRGHTSRHSRPTNRRQTLRLQERLSEW
jgi:hypothetical protein